MPTKPQHVCLQYAAITVLAAALFTWILTLTPGLTGVDGYFHIQFSKSIWQNGIPDTFSHLVYTIYATNFADDHFLFHIIQIPFTFGNLITGAKIYGVVFGTLSILLFLLILQSNQIRFASIWTLILLASSAPFLFRLSMARAPSISLCMLLLATYLALAQKDRWFILISALYVWFYGGFPLIAVLACSAFGASLFEQKKRPQILLYCGLGIVLGLIVHPYFPHNIVFLFKSYTQIEFADVVTAGNEDYPYASSSAVRNALLPWALTLATATYFFLTPKTLSSSARILFIFSTIILCMYMNVRRFVEYWPVFAVLFSAFALNPHLIQYDLKRNWSTHKGKLTISTVTLIILLCGWDTLDHIVDYRSVDRLPEVYAGAATYLSEASEENAIVFTGDWDDFPLLYHFNTHNRYIVGLDPHYLYYYDAKLYDQWLDLVKGEATDPLAQIKKDFHAQFIFSLKKDRDFLASLKRDPNLLPPVYEDEHAVVYKL
ncbi:MAG: hypothetical protein HOE48_18075 [Candidatus Latescibacteria bacterium]|nr:hypothetical protein [Candidatus Latescibacterota bacterium]MBT4139831.1 hypothetical protein [Candidatus Latescibacterota bacterium]